MNQHQLGIAEESTYGTYVAPTRALEVLPGESLDRVNTTINSEGLRPNIRYRQGGRRVLTRQMGSGNVSFEVATTDFGLLFKHMLGDSVSTSQPDATGNPTVYEHTFTPGDMTGLSLTIQKGVEQTDGTVTPFSFLGSKIGSWELSIDNGGILQLSLDVDSQDVDTGESLASLSYGALDLFHFAQGSLELDDGSIAAVDNASISGTNPMNTDRFFLGTSGLKDEPLENDWREITGTLDAEFQNLTDFYNRFAADTSGKLELIFIGDAISGTYNYELHVTLNDVRFTGEAPKIEGPGPASISAPFEALKPESTDAISILYRTDDTTP